MSLQVELEELYNGFTKKVPPEGTSLNFMSIGLTFNLVSQLKKLLILENIL